MSQAPDSFQSEPPRLLPEQIGKSPETSNSTCDQPLSLGLRFLVLVAMLVICCWFVIAGWLVLVWVGHYLDRWGPKPLSLVEISTSIATR